MRSRILLCFAALVTAFALVHCAGDNEESAPTSDDASVEAAADTSASVDASIHDASDAGSLDASLDARVAHCSLDHWCRTPLPSKDVSLSAVWSFGPDDAIAVGTGGLYHWDGTAWSLTDSDAGLGDLTSLWASGPNDVWAVAYGERRLLHGTRPDGGTLTWSSSETDGGQTRDIVTGAGEDLFIAGLLDDGTPQLQHSPAPDGGARTFVNVPITITPFSLNGIFAASKDEVFLAGRVDPSPAVLEAKRTGSNYVVTRSFTALNDFDFPAIWGLAPNEMWTIGGMGSNYHRAPLADGGGAWSAVDNDSKTTLSALWGSSASDVYAVGYLGGIRHWDGAKWSVSRIAVNGNPIFSNLTAVHGSSAADVWAVGDGIALHRTPTGGP